MKSFVKYLIESLVIILSVSLSFVAEQWRQQYNDKKENEELFVKAKSECEAFFSNYDTEKKYCNYLKRAMNHQSVDEDTLLMVLSYGLDEDINTFFPSVQELGKKKQLTPRQNEIFQNISGWISVWPKINQEYKDGLKKTEPLLTKYGIDNDLNLAAESYLSKTEKTQSLEPFDVKKLGFKHAGRYDLFFADPEVHGLLKGLYSSMINAQLWFCVSSIRTKEIKDFY
jgi:hypothetical protein